MIRLAVLSALVLGLAALPAPGGEEALAYLTRSGGQIALGELVPGLLERDAESAFVLLKDAGGRPVAAGGPALDGKGGRVIAFAHDGFLRSPRLLGEAASVALIRNALLWCGRDGEKIALHPGLRGLGEALRGAGLAVEFAEPGDLDAADPPAAYAAVAQRGMDEADIESLRALAARGMGLVLAATPWPFAESYPDFTAFPANRLAAASGLRMRPDGYADRSQPLAVSFVSSRDILAALAELSRDPDALEPNRRDALLSLLKEGGSLRGPKLAEFLSGLRDLNLKSGPVVPTADHPLEPEADPLAAAIVRLEDELNQSLPAGMMYAIPAAEDYPGAVAPAAPRETARLVLDGDWRGWLSGRGAGAWSAKEMKPTGCYAAPGEVITVTAPPEVAGSGFEVVIGAYGGGLSGRDRWHRYPRLQRAALIAGPVTRVSNALGGLVSIRVPRGASHGMLAFTIEGAVAAPLYRHGITSAEEWREEIRTRPAPWAELASDRMILALPSELIRDLDDPGPVMQVWNDLMDHAAWLGGIEDRGQFRAERLAFDRQTSAGYMHSGYPVAAHLDRSAALAVDAAALRSEGNWGFFHEIGHNHQHDLWALPGTTETTCNLWSVHLFEEYVGKPREEGHDALRPLDRKRRMNAYFARGRRFEEDWNVWTALETYLQVQEAFGWDPFRRVFAEYNALPESEQPRSQQDKNDQWVIRLSRACGRNLAPFWSAWNLPLSPGVGAALADLPPWEDHPVADLAR